MNLSSFKNFRAVGGKKTASPAANIFCNLLCFLSSVLASESCQMSGPKKFEPREEFAEGNFTLGGLRPQQKHPNHDGTLQGRVL